MNPPHTRGDRRTIAGETTVPPAQVLKLPYFENARTIQHIAQQEKQDLESVNRALYKAGGGRFWKIAGRNSNLGKTKLRRDNLRDDLLIEDEAIGIHAEIHSLQNFATKSPVTRVIFGMIQAEYQILQVCQETIADILPPRHSFLQCPTPL